jgi:hypothetical protein
MTRTAAAVPVFSQTPLAKMRGTGTCSVFDELVGRAEAQL